MSPTSLLTLGSSQGRGLWDLSFPVWKPLATCGDLRLIKDESLSFLVTLTTFQGLSSLPQPVATALEHTEREQHRGKFCWAMRV